MLMKIFTPLLLLYSCFASAQCIVDAGPPIHLCNDTKGGKIEATILQGTAPFKHTWSYLYDPFPGLIKQFTASDLLDDTTILQPFLRHVFPDNELRSMVIEVQDANGSKCSDWVVISQSRFTINTDATPKWIREGDSMELCAPIHLRRGFLPYKNYKWTDVSNISGAATTNCIYTTPFFRKDCGSIGSGYIGKTYFVTGTDSVNCPWSDLVDVAFNPTALDEYGNSTKIFCVYNPQSGVLNIELLQLDVYTELSVYDLRGKCLLTKIVGTEREVFIKDKIASTGVYLVTLKQNNQKQLTQRMFIER